jgi:hypothetical protein
MITRQITHRKQRLESDVSKVNEYPVLSGKYQLYCNQGIFVLFNSMLKYVINRLMHALFHIRTIIIPRPISILGLKLSGYTCKFGVISIKYVIKDHI